MFGFMIIKSDNMSPSIKPGSLIIYYKLNKEYNKDDVIVKKNQIYRIIGIKSDNIVINNNQLFINEIKEEDKIYYDQTIEYHLSDNEYFALNDNRRNINDSRSFGIISKIDGLVIAKIQIRSF